MELVEQRIKLSTISEQVRRRSSKRGVADAQSQ
jgi:hypothetical protein